MAAILDRTKILFDVHQGLMIGHDCAQYEWDPFIHVWEWTAEWFPYVKYMENEIGCLAAILDQKNKNRGYVDQWAAIDNVHAWPCSGNKCAVRWPYWIGQIFYVHFTYRKPLGSLVQIWIRTHFHFLGRKLSLVPLMNYTYTYICIELYIIEK